MLEALREAHPIVEKILQHRELTKLKNTYVDPLPSLVHPRTGRLHTRFNQTATATGRLSSSDPNLQNIPVRTPLGQRIRRAFVAEAGWALVALDYSQIELRVLAHLSGDENLIRVFQEGKDIHTQTASWMFGVPPEAVDPLMRRAAKTVNFGVLYGMSAHRLSQELAIPYEEAVAFIERYFQSFPKVRAWIEKTLEEGRKRGYVETLFGRRRYVPDLNARVKSVREAAERMAFNMPVQGTAADLMKLAMVKLFPASGRWGPACSSRSTTSSSWRPPSAGRGGGGFGQGGHGEGLSPRRAPGGGGGDGGGLAFRQGLGGPCRLEEVQGVVPQKRLQGNALWAYQEAFSPKGAGEGFQALGSF